MNRTGSLRRLAHTLLLLWGSAFAAAAEPEPMEVCWLIEGFADDSWLDDIKRFAQRGGDINAPCEEWDGSRLLHQAAAVLRAPVVEWLLANGADVNARGELGATPLHEAVLSEIENYTGGMGGLDFHVTRLLLQAGADPTIENERGETPPDIKDRWGYDRVDKAVERVFREPAR